MDCLICEAVGTVTESMQNDEFQIGAGTDGSPVFTVRTRVPVLSCTSCKMSWTGCGAEEIRNEAILAQTPYKLTADGKHLRYAPESEK